MVSSVQRKLKPKISHMWKVKMKGLYKRGYVWCAALKGKSIRKRGVDTQKFLSGRKFTKTGISGEWNLPGYSFCGPGTKLKEGKFIPKGLITHGLLT